MWVSSTLATSFQLIDISAQLGSDLKFAGAAPAANGMVIFVPVGADSVGVFDPGNESFQLIDTSAQLSSDLKFAGAVLADNDILKRIS